jgi:hypothetical protein
MVNCFDHVKRCLLRGFAPLDSRGRLSLRERWLRWHGTLIVPCDAKGIPKNSGCPLHFYFLSDRRYAPGGFSFFFSSSCFFCSGFVC